MVNRVFLLGTVAGQPVVRTTKRKVTEFRLQTSYLAKSLTSGSQQRITDYHLIVALDERAEMASQVVKEGKIMLVSGLLKTQSWKDKDGNKQYRKVVEAQELGEVVFKK